MNNNPVIYSDPNGDIPINGIGQGVSNYLNAVSFGANFAVHGFSSLVSGSSNALAISSVASVPSGFELFSNNNYLAPEGYGFVERTYDIRHNLLTDFTSVPPNAGKGTIFQTHHGYWNHDSSSFGIRFTKIEWHRSNIPLLAQMGGPSGMASETLKLTISSAVGGFVFKGLAKGTSYLYALRHASKARASTQGGLNLFKFGKPTTTTTSGWRTGDRMLHLPNKGSPKLNWKQNSGFLRQEMGRGKPIFDSFRYSNGQQIPTTGFLRLERNLLESRGWRFNSATGAYQPPF